ncbi:Surfeit locus protein 2 [Dillenia turbinata]|uniref:Surfeit locus protein 2 n=1 Tax=Dillenia turbinata TaxID=194707 RepID=A0AAN8U9W5_9MAGN
MMELESNPTEKNKEGENLLGKPTFEKLENGRFKCVETGHELTSEAIKTYSDTKKCRLGLIDYFLSHNKPPLNMFKQNPLSRSKLICKLTGDTINKSEEHIWKHINGKRFLRKLEEKEEEKLMSKGMVEMEEDDEIDEHEEASDPKKVVKKDKQKKKRNKNKKKEIEEEEIGKLISEVRNFDEKDSDSEEPDFWVPPVGSRWDFDDGGDRWASASESDEEDDSGEDAANEDEDGKESQELSKRTKRMSIEVGPSSFASRKKKSKPNSTQ